MHIRILASCQMLYIHKVYKTRNEVREPGNKRVFFLNKRTLEFAEFNAWVKKV